MPTTAITILGEQSTWSAAEGMAPGIGVNAREAA
jgi:hypothetical protein